MITIEHASGVKVEVSHPPLWPRRKVLSVLRHPGGPCFQSKVGNTHETWRPTLAWAFGVAVLGAGRLIREHERTCGG